MAKRKKTKFLGVYQREVSSRKNGRKPDICYDIAYRYRGRLIWEKVGAESEGYSPRLAFNVRNERIHAIRHGKELPEFLKPKPPFFRDMMTKYLKWAETNKADGGAKDRQRYKSHLEKFLGHRRLNEISAFDLENLKFSLQKKGLAAATVKHVLVLVRQVYNKASKWGVYLGSNPVLDVKLPRLNNARDRFLTRQEADLLLNELRKVSQQVHDISLLSLHSGLRLGEIANLKGRDVNLESRIISVTNPKNDEPRKVPMTEAVYRMFLSYMPIEPEELIFKDQHGSKIKEVSTTFRRVTQRLGLNDGIQDRRYRIVFHSLRHSYASYLLLEGEDILTVQKLLGHKTLEMVKRYAHIDLAKKRKATASVERFLGEEVPKEENVISIKDARRAS